jgi:hypothetical protein
VVLGNLRCFSLRCGGNSRRGSSSGFGNMHGSIDARNKMWLVLRMGHSHDLSIPNFRMVLLRPLCRGGGDVELNGGFGVDEEFGVGKNRSIGGEKRELLRMKALVRREVGCLPGWAGMRRIALVAPLVWQELG